MAKYQAYTEYKDSGVEWLGEIPRHWDSKPLKYLCTYNDEVLPETTAKDAEIQYIDIGSVSAVDGISKIEIMIFKDAPSRARRIVRDGDVIVSTVRTYLEAIAPINNPPENLIVSTGFAVIRPNQYLYKSFASYCLRAKGFIKEVVARSVGVSYPAINSSDLVNITIPSIEYVEQVKIANFLDHETAQIDSLIAKQEKLIELLKEKRQAVISHAVTKGLDPNVPMKDSGVAWLGEVPEHWDVSKFAYLKQVLTDYTANGSFADLKANVQYLDEPSFARLVRLTDLRKDLANTDGVWVNKKSYEYLKKSALYGGEFLLANVGAYAGLFYQMPFDKGYASLAPNMFMAKFNQSKVSREFMAYVGQSIPVSSQLRLSATASSAQPKLNKDDFKAVRFVYPGLKEQQKIVDYLDQELKQIDILLKKQEQAISLMQERRTALISAAVTGKIDVRNWQARMVAGAQTELSA
ncbi:MULTISPECIES: restriction endonuclease subunit S [Acinetobacter]|uniref:restriction endonuclease subunit S n=1 Tax=Acinetobacter TaxID=469 RepID=UPI0015D416D4|nr:MULTISPECIES: restriction endonuclease subunit S [Acinetobacter]QOW52493.1 restriction endonuclease subunit S [Acinetobacter indicus]